MSDVIAELSFVSTSHGIEHGAPPCSHVFSPGSLVLGPIGASKSAAAIFHADMEVAVVDIAIGVAEDTAAVELARAEVTFVLVTEGINVVSSTLHRVLTPATNVTRSIDISIHTVSVALVIVPLAFVGITGGILVDSLTAEASSFEVAFVLVTDMERIKEWKITEASNVSRKSQERNNIDSHS